MPFVAVFLPPRAPSTQRVVTCPHRKRAVPCQSHTASDSSLGLFRRIILHWTVSFYLAAKSKSTFSLCWGLAELAIPDESWILHRRSVTERTDISQKTLLRVASNCFLHWSYRRWKNIVSGQDWSREWTPWAGGWQSHWRVETVWKFCHRRRRSNCPVRQRDVADIEIENLRVSRERIKRQSAANVTTSKIADCTKIFQKKLAVGLPSLPLSGEKV